MKTIYVVVNAHASRAKKHLEDVKKLYMNVSSHKVTFQVADEPSKLENIYKRVLKVSPDVVVICGGDGTIITGINQLHHAGYRGSYGFVPLGTSNYFVRNLDLPLKPVEAVQVTLGAKTSKIVLPVANDNFFSLMATIGLSVQVADEIAVSLKRRIGQAAYLVELFRQIFRHGSFTYEISSPDIEGALKGRTHQIVVANADLSKQIRIVPGAKINEGKMHLTIFNSNRNIIKLVLSILFYGASFGRFRYGMINIESTNFSITTNPTKNFEIDSETIGPVPLLIELKSKNTISVIKG